MIENEINVYDATVLLVDDNPENLGVLIGVLEPLGYRVSLANSGLRAIELAKRLQPDLILMDVTMPDMDGFETCRRLKADSEIQDIPILFLTARVDTPDVVTGFQVGGVDYILKPFQQEELVARVETHIRLKRLVTALTEKNEALENEIAQRKVVMQERDHVSEERDHLAGRLSLMSTEEVRRWGIDGFVGKSKTLQSILADIARLQQSANTSVLITGESGTGKELIARAIHFGSTRASGPFIPVNCSAVPHELADSLFFGHVKGAFTGADQNREGYFHLADGGTLFLDEVGDMPLDLQAKLLRVLEERKVMPLGGKTQEPINVRILSATNANLDTAIGQGQFREDLYYRLSGFPVVVPPLRERKEDISLLAQHFLTLFGTEMGLQEIAISPEALDKLSGHAFPGNIRELKNVIERALIQSGGQTVLPEHLILDARTPLETSAPAMPTEVNLDNFPLNLDDVEKALIKKALEKANGNISEAARLLGINRMKIYRRITSGEIAADIQ